MTIKVRKNVGRLQNGARLLLAPLVVIGLAAACSDDGTAINPGTGGTATTGGSSGEGGTAPAAGTSASAGKPSNVAGTGGASGGGVTTGGAATAGTGGVAGGSEAGSGGTVAGTGGSAGTAGAAGTGGSAPVCPTTGGVDLATLYTGPQVVEAETAMLGGAATAATTGSGFSGTGYADFNASEGQVTWLVVVPAAADYTVSWRYAQAEARDMDLTVNCAATPTNVPFLPTGGWNTGWATGGTRVISLRAGTNQIVLATNGGSGANFDSLTLTPPSCAVGSGPTTCEAETALLSGAATAALGGVGATGTGFADMQAQQGAIHWLLSVPQAGSYPLSFVYTQDDTRDMTLTINGVVAQASLPFGDTNSWNASWASNVTFDAQLKAGFNSVELATNPATNNDSGPNFDSLIVCDQAVGGAGGAGGADAGGAGAGGAGGAP